ncbi:Coatomer subunit delta [Morella rubra]|uniref:Coatomer subunit delta n=1 Tax=Morella rubra TaxID=262757 RepID=A0A6A1VKM2_9ROSI|nr:Coatomer subunit delta [Morella rubra]
MGLRQQGDARFRGFTVSNVGSANTGGYGGSGDGNSGGRGEGSGDGGFDGDGGNNWSLLSWYLALLAKYPVSTKALTSALLTLIGDLICQPSFRCFPRALILIFAFDEVISLGHKENVTVAQVKQHCEMESHEEKLHKLVLQSKINETKDHMKRKASEIEKNKVTAAIDPRSSPEVTRTAAIDLCRRDWEEEARICYGKSKLSNQCDYQNSNGQLLFAWTKSLPPNSPLVDEARAALFAVQEASFLSQDHVIFEGDSKTVIDAITQESSPVDWSIRGIVADILLLRGCHSFWTFVHVKRDVNSVAHNLTKWAVAENLVGTIPTSVIPASILTGDNPRIPP